METTFNYAEAVWVSEHMVAKFMEMAKPQEIFAVERIGCQWVFSFSNDEDLERAEAANAAIMLYSPIEAK